MENFQNAFEYWYFCNLTSSFELLFNPYEFSFSSFKLLFNPYGILFSSYELLFNPYGFLLSSHELLFSFRASVNDVLKSVTGSSIGLEACRSYIILSIGSIGTFECFDFGYNGMYR
ncbi:hypothetical protein PVK06_007653 [Gossypium arboreum]|uniref:Uncharacterized protein n=1 Tax=Gossypium arboreum TaxID=29729 RepID=A0ABR0QIU3_GOSAR|nr:hypothetical protein PVK06_007653 [Gossypium arboreum]